MKDSLWNESKSYTEAYRFGFNGQEKDDEISGAGNSYTAEFWQYDSRLGRRFNIDPKPKTWESGYACFAGNPILINDIKGDSGQYYSEKGKLLHTSVDNLPNSVIVISDKMLGRFMKSLNEMKARTESNPGKFLDPSKDAKPNAFLRKFGLVFPLNELRDFYNNNSSDFNNNFKPTDGKGPIPNEHGTFMVNNNGAINLKDNWSGSPIENMAPTNKPANLVGILHIHNAEGRTYMRKVDQYSFQRGEISSGDYGLTHDLSTGDKRLNVVVSKSQIYLYSNDKIIIKVNGNFFKNK